MVVLVEAVDDMMVVKIKGVEIDTFFTLNLIIYSLQWGYKIEDMLMGGKSAERILNTIDELGDKNLTVEERLVFNALLEDAKNMDVRMTKLENNVSQIVGDVSRLNDKMNDLDDKMNNLTAMFKSIHDSQLEEKKNKQELKMTILKSPFFWIILMLLLIIISGIPISELKGIFYFTGK